MKSMTVVMRHLCCCCFCCSIFAVLSDNCDQAGRSAPLTRSRSIPTPDVVHTDSAIGRMTTTFARVLQSLAPVCDARSTCMTLSRCRQRLLPLGTRTCRTRGPSTEPHVCCPDDDGRSRSLEDTNGAQCARQAETFKSGRFGQQLEKPTPHVLGGRSVIAINAWPFMAGVFQKVGGKDVFLCAATIISRTSLLSAAHCFLDRLPTDEYVVRVGFIDQQRPESSTAAALPVRRVLPHPEFDYPSLYHDIALIEIRPLGHFSDSVRPVCLPPASSEGETLLHEKLTVLGWGSREMGGGPSPILQEAEVPVVAARQCQAAYAKIRALDGSFPRGITPSVLCAGNIGRPVDACQGDSGGPLVRLDHDKRWVQEGIVSAGAGCGTPGIPGVYTRLVHYLRWIEANAI